MGPVKLRLYPRDLHTVRGMAATLARLRCSLLTPEDTYVERPGTHGAGGTLLYSFKAHHEDADALHDIARQLIAANGLDIGAERSRIFGQVQREAEAAVDEPEWRP